jgi:Protein of unknown function (DUF3047)
VMHALAAMLLAAAAAQAAIPVAPFSSSRPGAELPPGWSEQRLPNAAPAEVSLVTDGGVTVLRVKSVHAAGGAIHALDADAPAAASLAWRWKIDRVVGKGDLARRDGDDFAARVYVFFGVPLEALSFGDRFRILLARLIYGQQLPTAGICYVWDNRHPAGTSAWNPYTDRIRMVVVETGSARAGQWTEVRRDLDADFRAAFGARWASPTPRVTGIAAGNDTDQTRESATAWFGDFVLEPRR